MTRLIRQAGTDSTILYNFEYRSYDRCTLMQRFFVNKDFAWVAGWEEENEGKGASNV